MARFTGLLLHALVGLCVSTPLNIYVSHYEPLIYNQHDLMWNHLRVRRSAIGPQEIELPINGFGRSYLLKLMPDADLFDEDTELFVDGSSFSKHHLVSVLYSGHDINDPSVTAHGHIASGVFDGVIQDHDEIYFIEPASRYFGNLSNFHSIIYRNSDINSSAIEWGSCASFDEGDPRPTSETMHLSQVHYQSPFRHTVKRQYTSSNKVRCWLSVLGDYEFYTAVTSGNSLSSSEKRTLAMATLSNIVKKASDIYSGTDFNGIKNINFAIKRLEVKTQPETAPPFNNPYIGVQAFLDYHSQADYSQYCLAYRFTYRQFDQGVIGLAYVAEEGKSGGICQTYSGGKTLNTGIVTLLNYGQRIPLAVNILTFAHEVGHNFGSKHDPDANPDCAPSNGKYIMYAHATDGSLANNYLFSKCSRDYMAPIINARRDTCFALGSDNCGNGLIDVGEDCDCVDHGPFNNGICLSDPCCNATSCRLTSGSICSPQIGVCCNSTCQYVDRNVNKICAPDTECAYNQTCNGTSSVCPTPTPKNFTEPMKCGTNGGYCKNGECNGTLCDVVLNVTNCECTDSQEACHVCCIIEGRCLSSFSIDSTIMKNKNFMGQYRQVGLPCGNFTGHCDFLNRCQLVNSDGAFQLLFKSLAAKFGTILTQLGDYWWAALLVGVGTLVAMFTLVVICHFLLPRPQKALRKQALKQKQQKDIEMHRSGR